MNCTCPSFAAVRLELDCCGGGPGRSVLGSSRSSSAAAAVRRGMPDPDAADEDESLYIVELSKKDDQSDRQQCKSKGDCSRESTTARSTEPLTTYLKVVGELSVTLNDEALTLWSLYGIRNDYLPELGPRAVRRFRSRRSAKPACLAAGGAALRPPVQLNAGAGTRTLRHQVPGGFVLNNSNVSTLASRMPYLS